jgi:hypothetical protein
MFFIFLNLIELFFLLIEVQNRTKKSDFNRITFWLIIKKIIFIYMEESQSILSVMAPSSNKMVKKGYESAK